MEKFRIEGKRDFDDRLLAEALEGLESETTRSNVTQGFHLTKAAVVRIRERRKWTEELHEDASGSLGGIIEGFRECNESDKRMFSIKRMQFAEEMEFSAKMLMLIDEEEAAIVDKFERVVNLSREADGELKEKEGEGRCPVKVGGRKAKIELIAEYPPAELAGTVVTDPAAEPQGTVAKVIDLNSRRDLN